MSTTFRKGLGEIKSSGVFEAGMLPRSEKRRLCESLLDEFGINVNSVAENRYELIIPCTITGSHQNQDREPTAALNWDKLTFKCLGCQASGGLLWFIAEHRESSVAEARDWLAKETGTDGQVMDLSALLRYFDALYEDTKQRPAPIPTYSPRTLDPWMLLHPWVTDPPVYDHDGRNVGGRGIPEESAQQFRVGYAEAYPMGTKERPAPPSERIVIPHFWQDRLVGWQTRRLANDGTPKYKSSLDFPKDTTLFNYRPEEQDFAVVVESPFSVLRHAHHLPIVATFGANITERQIRLLGRYRRVIFWLDNDEAGWRAYEDLTDNRGKVTRLGVLEAVSQMTSTWAVSNPYHADAADLDDETAENLVAEAVPWVLWRPPTALTCPRCGREAHAGGCG